MKYICDAPNDMTWFRIETDAEVAAESALMDHAVEKHFLREKDRSRQSYRSTSTNYIEQDIGLKAHLERNMPLFLTLRNNNGEAKVTAMLPPGGQNDSAFKIVIVGAKNSDPYPNHGEAIEALGNHVGFALERDKCYPYDRG